MLVPVTETEAWNYLHLEQTLSAGDLVGTATLQETTRLFCHEGASSACLGLFTNLKNDIALGVFP